MFDSSVFCQYGMGQFAAPVLLSDNQAQIASLLSEGFPVEVISSKIACSQRTLKFHLRALMDLLACPDQGALSAMLSSSGFAIITQIET